MHLNIDNRSDGYPMLAHAGEAYVHADVVSLPRLISISEEAAGRRAARGHMSDKPELEGIIWITEGERENKIRGEKGKWLENEKVKITIKLL